MRMPSELDLLDAWELAAGRQPCLRELLLLRFFSPELSENDAWNLKIGRKNDLLLTLRENLFGPDMPGTATCPACGERVEFVVRTRDLRVSDEPDEKAAISLDAGEYAVTFRMPVCSDLVGAAGDPGTLPGREAILARCILSATNHGEVIIPADLPAELQEKIVDRMQSSDSGADCHISLVCPSCRHEWEEAFDIGLFLWDEMASRVSRILYEVHMLASAYGWTEKDVLTISPARRQYYLEQVNG
jgi:hypothetical protein